MPKLLSNHLIIPFLLMLLACPREGFSKNIVEKQPLAQPAKLQALTPKLDESNKIQLHAEETHNLDISMQNLSGWNQLYSAGRTLFAQGDYRRALNAFRAAYSHSDDDGQSDTRDKATLQAIELTKRSLTRDSLLGYKLTASKGGSKVVEKVFRPSLAWLAGIKDGDRILSERQVNNQIQLTVSRNGRTYSVSMQAPVSLRAGTDPLLARHARADNGGSSLSGRITNPSVLQAHEKDLSKWDVAILIDCSGSMSSNITTSSGQMSKWQWCVASSNQLLTDCGKYFPNGITIVPFHSQYAVLDNVRVSEINRVYEALSPSGGTEMASPLGFVLMRHFQAAKRPLVVAVLTDGMPNDVDAVRSVIADAAARTTGDKQVAVTFLQVGNDGGTETLRSLDDEMVNAGAARDIVDSHYFDEIQQIGIKGGLVASMMEREAEGRAATAPPLPHAQSPTKKPPSTQH